MNMKNIKRMALMGLIIGLTKADPAFYCSSKTNTELKRYGDFEFY